MKSLKILICILITIIFSTYGVRGQGRNMSDAIFMGSFSCGGGAYSDTRNNSGYGNDFGQASEDIYYTFTLTGKSLVTISLCGSNFDTYLHLLDSWGGTIASNDDNGPACSGLQSSIKMTLGAGKYFVVSEGYSSQTGNIITQLSVSPPGGAIAGATMATAIDAGLIDVGVSFTDRRNNTCTGNEIGQASEDIFYKFTLNKSAEVRVSHCGSSFDTYIHLLNSSGSILYSNDDNGPECTGLQASIRANLSAGTYYVVSEGYGSNSGDIITKIGLNYPDYDKNWIFSRSFDEDGNIKGESKEFFSNEGKTTQVQQKNMATGSVIGVEKLYDAQGRDIGISLPAPTNSSVIAFKPNFLGGAYDYTKYDLNYKYQPVPVDNSMVGTVGWYYSNNNTLESYVPKTGYPYSRQEFFEDGTGAVNQATIPGDDFLLTYNRTSKNCVTPVANELDHYLQVRNKFFNSNIGALPASLSSSCSQTISEDADGKQEIIVRDKDGHVLMTALPGNLLSVTNSVSLDPATKGVHYFKILNESIISGGATDKLYFMDLGTESYYNGNKTASKGYFKVVATSNSSVQYTNSYDHISYNYYNSLGQLMLSIAPEGVKRLVQNLNAYNAINDIPFSKTFEYDLRGRLIAIVDKDAGRTEFVYTRDGKVRFSQNSEQGKGGRASRFSYTNYDNLNRPIESGEYTGPISFQVAKTDENLINSTDVDGGLSGGTKTDWVKTKYDFPDNSHGLDISFNQDPFNLKGAVSVTENENSKTWYDYDSYGRIRRLIRYISGIGVKTISYTYNSDNQISDITYQQNNPGEKFSHLYQYDGNGNLSSVSFSNNALGLVSLADYFYYNHGPIKRAVYKRNNSFIQGLDYVYTAQGWLKSINNSNTQYDPGHDDGSVIPKDVFSMNLEYYSNDYSRNNSGISSLSTGTNYSSYSGKIMGQSWRSTLPSLVAMSVGKQQNIGMFSYEYDDLNRFKSNNSGTPDFTNNSFIQSGQANREYGLTYDENGNILSLNRTDKAGATQNSFTYNYLNNTNRLTSVTNYANYQYNDLGQMIQEQKVDGTSYFLEYNIKGLIKAIYQDANLTQPLFSFKYDEFGDRVSKTDNRNGLITYYITDANRNLLAVYDNNGSSLAIKEVPIYGNNRFGILDYSTNKFEYELLDHLGNVRVVISETKKTSGEPEILYSTDYYPLGGEISYSSNDYRYGFQGQFSEKDKESGWLNFKLRMYDPSIGRWMTTDPFKQYSSPYVGMGNSWVNSIDPNGGFSFKLFAQVYSKIIGGSYYYNGKEWLVNKVDDKGTIHVYSSYLTKRQAGILDASIGVVGGLGEMGTGAGGEVFTGGLSTALIIDGAGRVFTNGARLIAYATDNTKIGDALPSNLGGMAGKLMDGGRFDKVGVMQTSLSVANDLAVIISPAGNASGYKAILTNPSARSVGEAILSYTGSTMGLFKSTSDMNDAIKSKK